MHRTIQSIKIDVLLILQRLAREPVHCFRLLVAYVMGTFYIFYYKIFRHNVCIKFPFKAFARVKIIGPGSVTIGRNNSVHLNGFRGLTIVTFSPAASVIIGSNCNLGGLLIRCHRRIEIGDGCMAAAFCLVQDSLFVCLRQSEVRLDLNIPRSIKIYENVWLCYQSGIIGGSSIGLNSVVGQGSWCFNYMLQNDSLTIGNPAQRALPIKKLLTYLSDE